MSYEDRKRANDDQLQWGKKKLLNVNILLTNTVSPFFKEVLSKEPELAPAVAAVNALTKVIEVSKGTTII